MRSSCTFKKNAIIAGGVTAGVRRAAQGRPRCFATQDARNRERIGEDGGCAAVVAALRAHGASSAIQMQACGALRNLAGASHKNVAGAFVTT